MATPKSTPSVARLIVAAAYALEHYDAGDLPAALAALDGMEADPLPDHPCWLAAALAQRSAVTMRGELAVVVARNWMAEARHRLRRELGEDILGAVTPVHLALRSALHCVEGLSMTSTTDTVGPDRDAGLVALTDACHTEARPERDSWRGYLC
jgi:hypothetical protein